VLQNVRNWQRRNWGSNQIVEPIIPTLIGVSLSSAGERLCLQTLLSLSCIRMSSQRAADVPAISCLVRTRQTGGRLRFGIMAAGR
jgi:hypothetical protein